MADRTHQRTQTDIAQERGPTGNVEHDGGDATSSIAATVAVVAGVLAVVAGIIPRLGVGALILAAVALLTGVPAMRRRDATSSRARTGVALAVVAVVLGAVNIAIQLDAFNYFTTAT